MSCCLVTIAVAAALWVVLTLFVITCMIQSVQDEDRYDGG